MITDQETNVVFVADTLKGKFPSVYGGLKSILEHHGIPLRIIPGTKDIWCRDYMPIQVSEEKFVQFRYKPDYLSGKYRRLRADGEIGLGLPWLRGYRCSEIVLDGGNVVKWSDGVILTEKVLTENPGWGRGKLLAELRRLLEVDRVILIPSEPGDLTGHADGIVRFVDGARVIVNDYRRVDRIFGSTLERILKDVGLNLTKVPYRPRAGRYLNMPPATGNYINFLQVSRLIVLPVHGLPEDGRTIRTVADAYEGVQICPLEASALAEEGGVHNCITWCVAQKE